MEAMRAFDSDKMSAYEEYSRPVRPAPARQDVRPVVGGMEGGPGVRYEHKGVEYPKDQRPVVGFVPPARKDGYPSAPPEVPYRSQERDLEEEGAFDPEAYRRKQREDIDMELALKRVEESKNKTPREITYTSPKYREKPFVPIEDEPDVYQAEDPEPRGSSEPKQPGELSPEEAGYIEFHRDNLYNNKFKRNEDGSITTIAGTIVSTKSGEAYLVPGYDPETGKVLSGQEAFDRAREIGLENFPVFRGGNAEENMERARAREIELKHIIEQDMHQWMRKHGMQAGGEVPQINKSGLIQGEGGPTTDSIPMRAEPDSFIVNAPAVEMVGKQNLDSAIHKVQKQQQQSGFNQFGNPVTGAQDINVSNGEYKVSKKDAERIGYDNLNRINDAGKPFVEQIDKQGYAEGDRVPLPVEKPSFVPTPIPKPEMLNVSGVDSLFSRADKQNLVNLLYAEDPTGRERISDDSSSNQAGIFITSHSSISILSSFSSVKIVSFCLSLCVSRSQPQISSSWYRVLMITTLPFGIKRVRRPAGYHSLIYLRPASENASSSDMTSSRRAI